VRDEPLSVSTPWRVLAGVVAAALLALGVGALLVRAAGFSEVRQAVGRADARWFAACLAAQVVALWAYARVVRGAFAWGGRPDPGFRLSAHVSLATIGAARVFAAGGVGAIVVAYWCFRRARFGAAEAFARVLGLNVLFYVVFAAGVWPAALAALLTDRGDVPRGLTVPWLLLVPLLAAVAIVLTRPGRDGSPHAGSPIRRVLDWAISGLAWTRAVVTDRAGRRLLAVTALYWVGNLACLWAALRSVGEGLTLTQLVLAFAAGHAAMILPLPLGGAGGVDAAMTYALTAVGIPLAAALVVVAVYRLFAFWVPTIPALVALLFVQRAGARLEQLIPARP